MTGVVFDVKRFAVHDGPGIRTTVFLKGCPLCCSWCHNPEGQAAGITEHAGRGGVLRVGRIVTVDEVVGEVARDTAFFDQSGGGVTFSGGEPLAQPDFLVALLDRCGELDLHRAVDTCGHAPRDVLLDVARRSDLFLYDLKLMADAEHLEHTGVEAKPILDNLRALMATGVPVRLRLPVVPGITDTKANLEAVGELLRLLPRPLPVDLLPYHRAAMDKYPRFGMEPPLPDTPEPTAADMAAARRRVGLPT